MRFYPSLCVNNELDGLTFSLNLNYWCLHENMSCWIVYNAQNCFIIKYPSSNNDFTHITSTAYVLHLNWTNVSAGALLHTYTQIRFDVDILSTICQIDSVVCKCTVLSYTETAHKEAFSILVDFTLSVFASTLVYFPIKCYFVWCAVLSNCVPFKLWLSILFPLHLPF